MMKEKERNKEQCLQRIDWAQGGQTLGIDQETQKILVRSMTDLDEGMSWTGSSRSPMQTTPTTSNLIFHPSDQGLEEQI